MVIDDDDAKVELLEDNGEEAPDSEASSDATANASSDGNAAPSRTPAFSSIGSPTVPTPESLQPARVAGEDNGSKPSK